MPRRAALQLKALVDGRGFLNRQENLLLVSNAGAGKSHLLSVLAHALLRQGRRMKYTSCVLLVQDLLLIRPLRIATLSGYPTFATPLYLSLGWDSTMQIFWAGSIVVSRLIARRLNPSRWSSLSSPRLYLAAMSSLLYSQNWAGGSPPEGGDFSTSIIGIFASSFAS
jgi:hypothetical protein